MIANKTVATLVLVNTLVKRVMVDAAYSVVNQYLLHSLSFVRIQYDIYQTTKVMLSFDWCSCRQCGCNIMLAKYYVGQYTVAG